MSLLDALLLDPHPFNVWIAVRTDGVQGSGTQSDPYDGSTKALAPLSASLAKDAGDASGKTIVATAVNHGYGVNDIVRITNAGDSSYAGEFAVSEVPSADVFKYVMKSAPAGNSTSASSSKLVYQFDEVMRTKVGPDTAIHIGPGVFETRGFPSAPLGWKPKSGQRITGAGMGLTTLKIAGGSVRNAQYWAVATEYFELITDFEAADFTVDCNSEGQPSPHVACAAFAFSGARRVRIRRVRAIRFGSHAPDGYVENFVFALGATHPAYVQQNGQTSDVVFEDCIAEQPSPNVTSNSTLFHMGGGEWPEGDETTEYHHGCSIRNCFVNAQNVYGPVVPVASMSYDGVLVTVTTKAPHLLTKPGNVLVRGVTVDRKTDNLFNGLFAIEQIVSDTSLKYRLVTTGTPDGTNATVGGGVPSHPVQIESLTPDDSLEICPFLALYDQQVYEPIRTHTLRTLEPHFRTANNNLSVGGVVWQPPGGGLVQTSVAFNGSFAVDEFDPGRPNELVYTLLQDPDADPEDLLFAAGAFVNIGHQALSADNGIATVVEGNRVWHATVGGPYHDTWQSRDLVCRENWYHDIIVGPFQNMGGVSVSPWTDGVKLDTLTHSGSTAIATTRNNKPHGFSQGNRILIFGDTSPDAALYNGEFAVTEVPDAVTFKYTMKGTPGGNASGARFRGAGDPAPQNLRPLQSLTRDANDHTLITAVMELLPDAPPPNTPQSQKHGLAACRTYPQRFFFELCLNRRAG